MLKASSYSLCIASAVMGAPQRGVIHSAFNAAANIVFPDGFILSLNAASFTQQSEGIRDTFRMPNGLQLSCAAGTFPFTALRSGMQVLFGAQRLHIEAIGCSLDLSLCSQWNPHIEHPEALDMEIVKKNREHLARYMCLEAGKLPMGTVELIGIPPRSLHFSHIRAMATFLCGRGVGLTPTGDDILAGWMAAGWLLYGSLPDFVEACRQIVEIAERQTHLLSRCWLSYALEGNVAQPICALLDALTQDDAGNLGVALEKVLAMGATSGHDLIKGILLMLNNV